MGKLINLELCKKLKFDRTDKRYLHNPEFTLENKTKHKILWDFDLQTDHEIQIKDYLTVLWPSCCMPIF